MEINESTNINKRTRRLMELHKPHNPSRRNLSQIQNNEDLSKVNDEVLHQTATKIIIKNRPGSGDKVKT